MKNGADPNEIDGLKETPLFDTSSKGHGVLVKVLLEAGEKTVYYRQSDTYGRTPIYPISQPLQVLQISIVYSHPPNIPTGKLNFARLYESKSKEKNIFTRKFGTLLDSNLSNAQGYVLRP